MTPKNQYESVSIQKTPGREWTSQRNAIGLISQIDSSPDTVRDRNTLAANMARNLRKELNTAIPISAALARTLQLAEPSGLLQEIAQAVQKFQPADWDFCLSSFEEWCEFDTPQYPLPAAERKRLMGAMPFEVFSLIAREMATSEYSAAIQNLWEISGFAQLKKLLQEHFLNRKRVLRCYKTITDLIRIFNEINLNDLVDYRNQILLEAKELLEMKKYVMICPSDGTTIRCKIMDRLEQTRRPDDSDFWEQGIRELLSSFEKIRLSLNVFNLRFEGLLRLEECRNVFSPKEQEELEALFRCHSEDVKSLELSESELISNKQRWMLRERMLTGNPPEKLVAHYAVAIYDIEIKNLREEHP